MQTSEAQATTTHDLVQKLQEDIVGKLTALTSDLEAVKVSNQAADEMFKQSPGSRSSSVQDGSRSGSQQRESQMKEFQDTVSPILGGDEKERIIKRNHARRHGSIEGSQSEISSSTHLHKSTTRVSKEEITLMVNAMLVEHQTTIIAQVQPLIINYQPQIDELRKNFHLLPQQVEDLKRTTTDQINEVNTFLRLDL